VVASLPDAAADEVYTQTGGNPFYVTDLLASCGTTDLPPSVPNAVVGPCLRLDDASRRLVELVSVVATRVATSLLDLAMPQWVTAAEEPSAASCRRRVDTKRGAPDRFGRSAQLALVFSYGNGASHTYLAGVAGSSRRTRKSPQRQGRRAVLIPQIPAYPRSAWKRHDRPVRPEVAGSSPVAPAPRSRC
jgi:hypothetical protein